MSPASYQTAPPCPPNIPTREAPLYRAPQGFVALPRRLISMHWLGLLCLLGAAGIVFRWYQRRVDSLGRRREFPWISMVALVLVGLGLFAPLVLRLWLQDRLNAAASEVIGIEVEVECQSFGSAVRRRRRRVRVRRVRSRRRPRAQDPHQTGPVSRPLRLSEIGQGVCRAPSRSSPSTRSRTRRCI